MCQAFVIDLECYVDGQKAQGIRYTAVRHVPCALSHMTKAIWVMF